MMMMMMMMMMIDGGHGDGDGDDDENDDGDDDDDDDDAISAVTKYLERSNKGHQDDTDSAYFNKAYIGVALIL